MIINAMKTCQGIITCIVEHYAQSTAANIAISGHDLIMDDYTFLMFHTYTAGFGGKSEDIVQAVEHTTRCLRGLSESRWRPFLTDKEIKSIHEGKELYLMWDDKTLSDRKRRHFRHDRA
jgi:ATP-dependent protease ClpP protease subunit